MELVGNTFYQTSGEDPGVGYPMYYWNQTDTGLIYIRSANDGGWVLVGDSSLPYMGNLSNLGGTMNGAITGAHGLALEASNDYTTSLYYKGLEVATKQYYDQQVANINATIHSSLSSVIASIPVLDISAQIVHKTGTWTSKNVYEATPTLYSIDLPFYPLDGTQALESECIWGAYWPGHDVNMGFGSIVYHFIEQVSNRVYKISCQEAIGQPPWTNTITDYIAKPVIWWIIAFRSRT